MSSSFFVEVTSNRIQDQTSPMASLFDSSIEGLKLPLSPPPFVAVWNTKVAASSIYTTVPCVDSRLSRCRRKKMTDNAIPKRRRNNQYVCPPNLPLITVKEQRVSVLTPRPKGVEQQKRAPIKSGIRARFLHPERADEWPRREHFGL